VAVRNTELPIRDILAKRERFDVSCKIDSGDQIEVEMQADPMEGDKSANEHMNIRGRSIFNVCDLHSSQKSISVPYGKLARTYQITFCGYTVFEGRESCFNCFSFRNPEGEELLNAVNILFVELSKLKRVLEKPVTEMTSGEMWAVFLAYANKPQHREVLNAMIAAKEEIRVAYGLLTSISQDEDERARFRARRKFQMDLEHNRIVSFEEGERKGFEEGERKGFEEGERKGFNEGERKGFDEGERKTKHEVARSMLTDGLPVEKVVQYTCLPREEIEKLRT
jgi:predicted transposase/invertase (TIGR01784 family)